jgi:glycosyltransferase involved in cell wall biosynthesis
MKIAIIAPSPVPFGIGGAENLWWGLLNEINQYTLHQAEVIKLPSPENSFWELMQSYKQFLNLDLSHFDRVISGKYPGWMVKHDGHICYMLHRLRGLYDTYPMGLAKSFETHYPSRVVECQKFMQRNDFSRSLLPELFSRLEALGTDISVPDSVFQFPGPFSREVIHFLDGIGLASCAIKKYAAISSTVANRNNYFPLKAKVDIIYPPSNLSNFHCSGDDYLFTVSRLDGPKRIALLIEAMYLAKSNIRLKIAGTGPDEERLKKLAKKNPGIEFLGFIKDREVIDLYADALAVPYVPYDEDYGLVTIEAMMSGKPVLTVSDSGGPTEFVKNGETGFCVPPTPDALAEKIDYLCTHRSECRQMGQTGRKLVSTITWGNTVSQLLGEPETHRLICLPSRRRKKLTVATTFPIYPPRGGGQSRIYHLYRHFAQWWDIDIVSFTGAQEAPFEGEIAPRVREIRIPKSKQHEASEQELSKAINWTPVTDVAMPLLHSLTPAYAEAIRRSVVDADVIVASHPYLVDVLLEAAPSKPLWFEAQDVEIDLKTKILGDFLTAIKLLEETRSVEARCWKSAAVTYACSNEDLDRLYQLYGATQGLLLEVPNGVSLEDVPYIPQLERQAMKIRLGLPDKKIALFMGSWHGPNLEAIEYIFDFAQKLPEVFFLILGSSGLAFNSRNPPGNVGIAGVVDDETKSVILSIADVALNPMTSGSGTNLKMLDYFAAGLPVISTEFGARGLGCKHNRELLIVEIDDFHHSIRQMFSCSSVERQQMITTAYDLATNRFDWEKIAKDFYAAISNNV